jgi:hypothetical protein
MYQNPDTKVVIPVSIISPLGDDTDTNQTRHPVKGRNNEHVARHPHRGADSFHSWPKKAGVITTSYVAPAP